MLRFPALVLLCLVSVNASAQLQTDLSHTPEELVKTILLGKQSTIKADNISYKGAPQSIGSFRADLRFSSFIKKGIILSTGDVIDAGGPNTSTNKGTKTALTKDRDLEGIAKDRTFDAAVLEFDFETEGDSIAFNFLFASEEYPEFVKKHVNDVFAIWLSEGKAPKKNLALLPNRLPISVDNVNAVKNSAYYIANEPWTQGEATPTNAAQELSHTFEFDGFSTLIRASAAVEAGKMYHLKFAIADVGDRNYNSAIFLEAGSFSAPLSAPSDLLSKAEKELQDVKTEEAVSINLNIHFAADSARVSDKESFALLDRVIKILTTQKELKLEIRGHTDDSGKAEHNKRLSAERADNVVKYLLLKGVPATRLKSQGLGSSMPLNVSDKSRNRRVEFIFTR